jgi:hypothetical protein
MLRINTTSTAWTSSTVVIFAILALTALPANATTARQPGDAQGYFTALGEEMKQVIYRELPDRDRQALHGHVATIDVRYSAQGQFETARVRSADVNCLATALHRKLVWKALPPGIKQTVARLEIRVIDQGRIIIDCESH